MRGARSQIVVSGFAGVFLLATGRRDRRGLAAGRDGLGVGSEGGVWPGAVVGAVGAVLLLFSVSACAVIVGIRASQDQARRRR